MELALELTKFVLKYADSEQKSPISKLNTKTDDLELTVYWQ